MRQKTLKKRQISKKNLNRRTYGSGKNMKRKSGGGSYILLNKAHRAINANADAATIKGREGLMP